MPLAPICGLLLTPKQSVLDRRFSGWREMPELSFEFIGNACGIFRGSAGTRLLCDPWILDGVFEGSWCHYPPLSTRPQDVLDVDAVYVSHLHPDHYDERTFNFPLDTPLVVLDHGPNFLPKMLRRKGYSKLVAIKDGETVAFNELRLTMFAPFARHTFHAATVGNLIDSALVVEDKAHKVLNANDNVLTPDAARELRARFGQFDLAMLNYNSAGPYPSCFDNYTHEQKRENRDRIMRRNFEHLDALCRILEPRMVLPFAGAYVLGGRQWRKNDYLATTTWDECAELLRAGGVPCEPVVLREHDVLDIKTGRTNRPYVPVDKQAMAAYIESVLALRVYPHEEDAMPDPRELASKIEQAAERMHERMPKYGLTSTFDVIIFAFDRPYRIYPDFCAEPDLEADKLDARRLECRMDPRLLNRIVDGTVHWNNAEGGAHIDFIRTPDIYEYDVHTALELFHL